MGLKPSITAITFVALGTSLPDTFASMAAAKQDPHADASIGNVTGSNSVNVFLGLGLPWLIATIVWAGRGATPEWKERFAGTAAEHVLTDAATAVDGGFVVPAGALGFSVTLFCCCACITLLTLVIRRHKCGGELGGTSAQKWGTFIFFVTLWGIYIAGSAGQAEGWW